MVNYDFYVNIYPGGSIPSNEWSGYERRAAAQLAQYRRIYQIKAPRPKAADMAVCAMAEALYSFDLLANGEAGPIQSASIGSVSVGYGGAGTQAIDLSPKGQARELYRCASLYLDIYRGVG